MSEVFGSAPLIGAGGRSVESRHLDGRYIGLYFASHGCAACREFTPQLISFYKEAVKSGAWFEIVFISSDNDEETALKFFVDMPWLMLAHRDRATQTALTARYSVHKVPSLVVLDKKGELLTNDGLLLVSRNIPVTEWHKKAHGLGKHEGEGEHGMKERSPFTSMGEMGHAGGEWGGVVGEKGLQVSAGDKTQLNTGEKMKMKEGVSSSGCGCSGSHAEGQVCDCGCGADCTCNANASRRAQAPPV